MKFSIWDCIHHYHGLRHRCNRNGTDAAHHDTCDGECDYWINCDGENRERVLERLCIGSDK